MPTMTVYITERGTPMADGGTSAAGHMWFSISQDGTNQKSYGFAPVVHGMPAGPGQVYNDDIDNYAEFAYELR